MAQVKSFLFRDVLSSNSTSTAFTAKTPTATEPSGTGVLDFTAIGVRTTYEVPETLVVVPYGTDAANETFAMRIWGWTQDESDSIWIPRLLSGVACTLGNVSYAAKGTNHFLCDTVTSVVDGAGHTLRSPTSDLASAQIEVPTQGVRKIELDFDSTGAAAMNALYRFM